MSTEKIYYCSVGKMTLCLVLVLLCAMTSCSKCSKAIESVTGAEVITPVIVTDADEIYEQFKASQEPIAVARDSTRVTIERYIKSKIGTDFGIEELDFSFVRYSLDFGEKDDAIFKVNDRRFKHELYVIGFVDARRVKHDTYRTYRLSGTFKKKDYGIVEKPVGVVGRGDCLSFGLLRFEPLEVTEK